MSFIFFVLKTLKNLMTRSFFTSGFSLRFTELWSKIFIVQKNLKDIYLFKVSNGNTRAICEIFSKLATKTTARLQ